MIAPSEHAWDLVIAGGGLSGLALATELSAPEFAHLKIAVFEARGSYTRDKTWSYWDSPQALPPLWSALAKHRWNTWQVSLGEQRHTMVSATAYASLPSDEFYSFALSRIARAPQIQLFLNEEVSHTQSASTGVTLQLKSDEHLKTRWLADARPPQSSSPLDWMQHFLGWEIHTPTDRFNAETMGLMHFDVQDSGLNFLYVLPYTARHALVENTWVSRAHVQPEHGLQLKEMIAQHFGLSAYKIAYQERGALPLLPVPPQKTPYVFHLGRSAGCLRASTGFAFANSLWHAHRVAHSLREQITKNQTASQALRNWQPPVSEINATDLWMDRVFFQAMEDDWSTAPQYFMQMFTRVSPEPIIRFMQGSSRIADRMAIMQALPKIPFLRAALQLR
jgi:lycopene beta-cyclase